MNKKVQGISILNVIIIATVALAMLLIIALILIFTGRTQIFEIDCEKCLDDWTEDCDKECDCEEWEYNTTKCITSGWINFVFGDNITFTTTFEALNENMCIETKDVLHFWLSYLNNDSIKDEIFTLKISEIQKEDIINYTIIDQDYTHEVSKKCIKLVEE